MIQIGGFGFIAGAILVGLRASRRLGLSTRLLAQAETRAVALAEVTSVLKLTLARELGAPDIWAKASGPKHGKLLTRTGAHHAIYPEASMGERVEHLATGKMIDFIEFDNGFAITKTRATATCFWRTLSECALRTLYGITGVCVKRAGQDCTYATPQTRIEPGDLLIVSGATKLLSDLQRVIERGRTSVASLAPTHAITKRSFSTIAGQPPSSALR